MAINRSWPGRLSTPGYIGRFIVDTYRGQMRIRAWPRKRGKVKSALQKVQTDWFKHVQRQWREIPAIQQYSFRKATEGSGLYPRDLFMKAKAGTMMPIFTPEGRLVYGKQLRLDDVNFQGFVLWLSSNQSIASGGFKVVTWPTPLIQTAPFWDAGSPTLITIPEGVEVMRFGLGMKSTGALNGGLSMRVLQNGSQTLSYLNVSFNGTKAMGLPTPPWPVTPGDTIQPQIAVGTSGTLAGNEGNYFYGEILQGS